MKQIKIFLILMALVLTCVSFPAAAQATNQCYCEPSANVTSQIIQLQSSNRTPTVSYDAKCLDLKQGQNCDVATMGLDANAYSCQLKESESACTQSVKLWQDGVANATKKGADTYSVVGIAIPKCLFDPVLTSQCKDVSTLIRLLINFASWAFGVIGAIALVVFVYAGFTLILSRGNAEKVQQGFAAMTAAAVGLFIAFAAYLLIKFVGDALGIRDIYKLQ